MMPPGDGRVASILEHDNRIAMSAVLGNCGPAMSGFEFSAGTAMRASLTKLNQSIVFVVIDIDKCRDVPIALCIAPNVV